MEGGEKGGGAGSVNPLSQFNLRILLGADE